MMENCDTPKGEKQGTVLSTETMKVVMVWSLYQCLRSGTKFSITQLKKTGKCSMVKRHPSI